MTALPVADPNVANLEVADPKNAILDAAQALIAEHGYAGFSIRDLSRDSNLAKGTIYYHFKDKLEIYRSVMARALSHFQECLEEAIQTDESPIVRLRRVVLVYLSLAYDQRLLMITLMREFDNLEGEFCDMAEKSRETILAPIASLLQDGINSGDFRSVPLEVAAMALFGALNAYIGHRIMLQNQPWEEEMIDQFLNLYLYGLVQTKETV